MSEQLPPSYAAGRGLLLALLLLTIIVLVALAVSSGLVDEVAGGLIAFAAWARSLGPW